MQKLIGKIRAQTKSGSDFVGEFASQTQSGSFCFSIAARGSFFT
ncbi:hypothetical protein [Neglectibacter caecimuris]|nr:hypothetical protein [Neglectibacter sp. M00184]